MRRTKKIVSFAVWGTKKTYLQGAIENLKMLKDFYPDWEYWFYCHDELPEFVLQKIKDHGGKVFTYSGRKLIGSLERFKPMDDPECERFIVRDTDSRPCPRELVAVNEWIESGLPFHIMRDNIVHRDLILAGMWGSVGGLIDNLSDKIDSFVGNVDYIPKNLDQQFLAQIVWPLIADNHLAHDEYNRYTGKERPFPKHEESETIGTIHFLNKEDQDYADEQWIKTDQ